ncbi:S24 family peptidase [Sphingobium sp. HBC34]|uniref:S24 family peptidase n=1 Tax=Sphingobium cyanobacteriorum TaxID=3063954 RepID=A0ABT8ZT88_9SPHN|nr:S24 family peptidase [Sphingobium sp. HBC34]MDO7836965.1 S24 family peptidase [Sphingobium sp. HBC34]
MEQSPTAPRTILARLIAARGDNYASLSKLLGRNPAYIQQFIKRGTPRKLEEGDRHILARYFGIAEELLGGSPAAPAQETPHRLPLVVSVPRLALGASAGAGSFDADEQPVGLMLFDAAWLRKIGVKAESASIIQVDGESMAPTLRNGDEIMVDHMDAADRLRDGLYVLRLDGVLMVKRITLGPLRGHFSLLSDNPHYPDWMDVDPALVAIVGRIVWTGRTI